MIKSLVTPLLALGCGAAALHAAESYTFRDLTPGSYISEVTALDDAGRVTGATTITNDPADPDTRPFVWENGKLGIIPIPLCKILSFTEDGIVTGSGPYFGDFSALWKNGVISPLGNGNSFSGRVTVSLGENIYAGIYKSGLNDHAFVRSSDSFEDLTPSGDVGKLLTVTPSGYLVGAYSDSGASGRVFSWKDGVRQDITPVGAKSIGTLPEFTNEGLGQIVGTYSTESYVEGTKIYAYIWRDGVFTTLAPGSPESHVTAVGSEGEVAGDFKDSSGRSHAFLWQDGVFTDLTPTGTQDSFVKWIADSGHILIKQGLLLYQWKDGSLTPVAPAGSLNSDIGEHLPDGTVSFGYQDASRTNHAGFWKDGNVTVVSAPWLTDVQSLGVIDRTATGRFVFEWIDGTNAHHAFIWEGGVATEITPPTPGASIYIKKVTPSGYMGGVFRVANGNFHPFIWFQGVATDLSHPSEDQGQFMALNDSGMFGGVSYFEEDPINKPGELTAVVFLWKDGEFKDLPDLPNGRPYAIDDVYESGMVIGAYSYEYGGSEGFVWKDGDYIIVPGAISMSFARPNAQGVSLGSFTTHRDGQYRPHIIILEDNIITDIEDFLPPETEGSSAIGFNASGQIAGAYTDVATGRPHAFLLSPGPATIFPDQAQTSTSSAPVEFKPSLSISKHPPSATNRRMISIHGTAIGHVSYRTDSSSWRTTLLRSPGRWLAKIPLKVGQNAIYLRAKSSAGKSQIIKIKIFRRTGAL